MMQPASDSVLGLPLQRVSAIYIISNPGWLKANRFKFGLTATSELELRDSYLRALPDLILAFFYPTIYARQIETAMKRELATFRVENESGNLSEHVIYSLEDLKHVIRSLHHRFDAEAKEEMIQANLRLNQERLSVIMSNSNSATSVHPLLLASQMSSGFNQIEIKGKSQKKPLDDLLLKYMKEKPHDINVWIAQNSANSILEGESW